MLHNIKALLLSAGLGTRLRPLTNIWPKGLMPIRSRPLLEYWLSNITSLGIKNILVNTHYCSEYFIDFIENSRFSDCVDTAYEAELLGTAGTIRKNIDYYRGNTLLLAHADNFSCCDYLDFLDYHCNRRPKGTVMTMMTFLCETPSSCGIVELDDNNIVIRFHEKVDNPPGSLANAAVYLLDPAALDWIESNPDISDFSTEVLPHFVGKIATWENREIHKDIGTIDMLTRAQSDNCDRIMLEEGGHWQEAFLSHPIHNLIKENEFEK